MAMSKAAISTHHGGVASPGLTSIFETMGPPSTPDGSATGSSAPRLVQKLVVHVKGKSDKGLVVLYMRLAVPASFRTQTFPLFSDEGVTLKSSQVDSVSVAKGGKTPVLPTDASRQLRKAHEILGNRATASTVETRSEDNNSKANGSESRPHSFKRAKLTISNFNVALVVPPQVDGSSTLAEGNDKLHFIAIAQLRVTLSQTPPKWPYLIRIPIPRCLNNFLQFSVDEDAGQGETIVEVDPPLLPKPPALTRRKSELEAVDSGADDDQALSGPFILSNCLCIRWAKADAAMNKDAVTSSGNHPIRADQFRASVRYSNAQLVNETMAEFHVDGHFSLEGLSYPGLEQTANVHLYLDSPSSTEWAPHSVSVVPSKQSTSSLHFWSTTRSTTKSSMHSIRSTDTGTDDELFSPFSGQSPHDSQDDDSSDVDVTLNEEGNLLDVLPPKGIASTDFDTSYEDDGNILTLDTLTPSRRRSRRHSLGLPAVEPDSSSSKGAANNPATAEGNGKDSDVYLVLNVASIKQFTCSIKGTVRLPVVELLGDAFTVALPFLRAHGMPLQGTGMLEGTGFRITRHGSAVRVMDDSTKYEISLPSSRSKECDVDCAIVVRVEQRDEGGEEADTTAGTRMMTVDSDDRLELYSNGSPQQAEGREGEEERNHMSQVDMLSGIIQSASVQVFSTTVHQENLLLEGGVHSKVKTTHVIRSSWPSTTPSSDLACGSLLQRIVFAIPCTDDGEVQVLFASLNGRSVCVGDRPNTSSRIVDLRLPDDLREAKEVQVYLLYSAESAIRQPLCVFPAVASSIADLSISFHNDIDLDSTTTSFTFANPPLVCKEETERVEGRKVKQMRALMLPAMASVTLAMADKAVVSIAAVKENPLRRTTGATSRKHCWGQRAQRLASALHLACTLALAVGLIGMIIGTEPLIGSLSRKVDSLAIALNVDFSDGTWKPDQSMPGERSSLHNNLPVGNSEWTMGQSEPVRGGQRLEQKTRLHEQNELSTDTNSFASVLKSLSLGFAETVSWPLRMLFSLWSRARP